MSRRDEEPVAVADFATRALAETAWEVLTSAGIPSAVVTESPPWGAATHRVQVARRQAADALQSLAAAELLSPPLPPRSRRAE